MSDKFTVHFANRLVDRRKAENARRRARQAVIARKHNSLNVYARRDVTRAPGRFVEQVGA